MAYDDRLSFRNTFAQGGVGSLFAVEVTKWHAVRPRQLEKVHIYKVHIYKVHIYNVRRTTK